MSSGVKLGVHVRHGMILNPWLEKISLMEKEEAKYENYAFVAGVVHMLLLVAEVSSWQLMIQEYAFLSAMRKERNCLILTVKECPKR